MKGFSLSPGRYWNSHHRNTPPFEADLLKTLMTNVRRGSWPRDENALDTNPPGSVVPAGPLTRRGVHLFNWLILTQNGVRMVIFWKINSLNNVTFKGAWAWCHENIENSSGIPLLMCSLCFGVSCDSLAQMCWCHNNNINNNNNISGIDLASDQQINEDRMALREREGGPGGWVVRRHTSRVRIGDAREVKNPSVHGLS